MRTAIFGAGQAGIMASRWLPAEKKLVCYIDNDEKKQGTVMEGIPLCSLAEALEKELEFILIAVLNKEAAEEIKKQITAFGYAGKLTAIQELQDKQNIRLAGLRLIADEIRDRGIPGEMAELGVYQGAFAAEMNRLLPEKKLYLFDTFEGFDQRDLEIEAAQGSNGYRRMRKGDFADTSIELVKGRLPYPEQAVFYPGYFPQSADRMAIQNVDDKKKDVCKLPRMALVSLDPDLYEPVYQGLRIFYPLLNKGGVILIHDYNSAQFPGVKKAVRRYCKEQGLYVIPLMDLHGSAVLIKQGKN